MGQSMMGEATMSERSEEASAGASSRTASRSREEETIARALVLAVNW